MKSALLLILSTILTSCAGYKVVNDKNPYKEWGILSISIPMFINRSSIVGVSPHLTESIKRVLEEETSLKVYAGNDGKSDAVLVGIIDSANQYRELYKTTTSKYISGNLEDSIGEREPFYIPTQQKYNLNITLVLVRRPRTEDMKIIESELLKHLYVGGKFIFNKRIDLSGSYSREIKSTTNPDHGGIVGFTNAQGNLQRSYKSLGDAAARIFREEILNVF